jgi:hypothetical protein
MGLPPPPGSPSPCRRPKVGFAENIRVAVPIIDTPPYVKAAEAATREQNAGFDTLERKPKLSAEWFREAARQNAVV